MGIRVILRSVWALTREFMISSSSSSTRLGGSPAAAALEVMLPGIPPSGPPGEPWRRSAWERRHAAAHFAADPALDSLARHFASRNPPAHVVEGSDHVMHELQPPVAEAPSRRARGRHPPAGPPAWRAAAFPARRTAPSRREMALPTS